MACKTFTVGESGTIIRADAARDISDNTELRFIFNKPDGGQVIKTKAGGQVTLGTVDVFDESLKETLLANHYAEYVLEADIFDIPGDNWERYLNYQRNTVSPPINKDGRRNFFTVIEA